MFGKDVFVEVGFFFFFLLFLNIMQKVVYKGILKILNKAILWLFGKLFVDTLFTL